MKDPAFLFYSRDYYEGTRMMLPEERACYVDLLIYQHQNGFIPNDPKRLSLYCSGVDEATLKATLEAKFKLTDQGWYNEKLKKIILERENYKGTQSENGKVGQFMKKAKAILSEKDYGSLVSLGMEKADIIDFMTNHKIEKATLEALLKRCLSNKEDANAIVIVDKNEDIVLGGGEKKIKTQKQKKDFIPSEFTIKMIGYFNQITNSNCKPVAFREKYLNVLLKSGYTEEQMISVIKYKYNEWKGDSFHEKNINFDTFFREENFIRYQEAAERGALPKKTKMVY